jgi:SAM-dependent methyltransferase
MPFSLNLPVGVAYPLTRLARRLRSIQPKTECPDLDAYFEMQYRSTPQRYALNMGALDLRGKEVLDVGSGLGGRAPAWLELGARRVINVDLNRQELEAGRNILTAWRPDLATSIEYRHPDELSGTGLADVAILFDVFEHLVDPAEVLRQIHRWLRPGGQAWIGSIGWYNHLASHCTGGHIPIPWCQVLFSETAIIKTIRRLLHSPGYEPNFWERTEGLGRWDGVTTLRDRPGEPLNMLSLRRIRKVLNESPLRLLEFRVTGFSGKSNRFARVFAPLARLPVLQELLHSYYTALLEKN